MAISADCFAKKGGTVTLAADLNTGATYGLVSKYFKSVSSNISTTGVIRLANNEGIGFRNAANGADLILKVNSTNGLEYNGTLLGTIAAALTASRALVSDGSGNVTVATTTTTELNYLAGVTTPTGSGALVLATSPTLVTPTLGVASATSINKVAITAPATGATLVLADGKTLTVSNTLTFTGTDSSSVAFGAGGTVVYDSATQTLTNKTLSGNTAVTLISGSGVLTLNTSGTVTLPNATDTLVGKATTDTLTNKTLTSPIISSISNTGTLTLPTSTDTLVGRATTDTLTNKTLTAPSITTDIKLANEAVAKFYEASGTGTHYIGIKAPASVTADKTFILPDGDGGANQVLKTDGSANLGWATVATTVTTTRGDVIKRGASADERLAIGAADKVLVSDGTDPSWGLTVKSGTYTATLTNASNCSVLTFNKANYLRIGNIVHVSVYATITTTAAAPTNSYFYVSLPIASNLAVTGDLIGSGTRYRSGNTAKEAVGIEADTAGDRAVCYFGSTEVTAAGTYLSFMYEVL